MADETWVDETITLFSNGHSKDGSQNTPSRFNVALPRSVNLNGMEVGVRNVTLPTSWNPVAARDRAIHNPQWCATINYNATSKKGALAASIALHARVILDDHVRWVNTDPHNTLLFTLVNKAYKTGEDVLRQILRQTYAAFPLTHFPRVRLERKVPDPKQPRYVYLELAGKMKGAFRLWINESLRKMLHFGLDPNDPLPIRYLVTEGKPLTSQGTNAGQLLPLEDAKKYGIAYLDTGFVCLQDLPNFPTISAKNSIHLDTDTLTISNSVPQFQRFHIYTDFIQNRIVGSIRTGLLTVIPNPGLDTRLYSASYAYSDPIPLYMKTENTVYDNFNFVIRDDNGDLIDFDWGSTSVELHFRRRRGAKRGWMAIT